MTTTDNTPETALRHHHQPGTARAALSYRNFRILFMGTALSSIGTWMQNFTLPAYVDSRTGSASLVGLLVFVQLGPLLLLSIPAGMLADRLNRTRLVIAMQSVMMTLSVVLAVLVWQHAPLWTLFAAQLALGIANTVNAPAFSASIPMLVDRQDLAGAISLNSAMINGTRILGPAIAALLAAISFSIAQLFLVNAATYLFLIVPLFFVKLPQASGGLPERGWRKVMSGINIVRRRRGTEPHAAHDVHVLVGVPALHRAVPIGGTPQLRRRGNRGQLQAAVRRVGAGGVLRCARGRHLAVELRHAPPDPDRHDVVRVPSSESSR